MKNFDIASINSLFQTDWHPKKGDYVKENSIKDGRSMQDQVRKHKITVWLLSSIIFATFIISIVLLSIES